ncbi:ABC transporter [Sulfuriferula thiophila]|uniref:ABC transporter n=1 Tax=Sulfuriferula thiophila TaxID=1781211 RepID=UPI000F60880C|nr:ABC transporter [Sulfuriferula thiophila]
MIEDRLIEKLSEGNEVDGHDIGAEEINIFIRTDNTKKTFSEIKSILGDGVYWTDVRVAYREVAKSEYIILWPQSLTKFAVK